MPNTAATAVATTTIVTINSTSVTPRQRAGNDMAPRSLRHRDESAERIDLKRQRLRGARRCADHGDGRRTGDCSVGTEKQDGRRRYVSIRGRRSGETGAVDSRYAHRV